ncbi:serine hydrolase domain-containing protein [Burkholderia sp. lig30]|uniref:serine hydrolase domain-containing protein n=1 Tax=Burkholderia sp. lig30 TaxID=1192124 RepID=UPI0005728247|nr:serine hydrolase [Burkholderia sp. lig30]
MPPHLKRLTRWSVMLVLLAAFGYAGYLLSRLAPIGTAYAAKTLCSGVFVSGRPAATVIDEDIMAGVHPLLKLVDASVDAPRRLARASFVGLAVREAVFRPGLGCTLSLGALDAALPAGNGAASNPPLPQRAAAVAVAAPPGVDARKLKAAIDSAFAEPNPAEPRRTRAVVVMYRGHVIAERYAPGITADMPLLGWSMTKSVTGALAGVLVKEGKLAVGASALLPEWSANGDVRARITLDELLRMTSGLQFNEDYDDPLSDVAVMLFTQADASGFAANKPLVSPPGTRWRYSSGTTAILARVLYDALAEPEADYLQFPRRALFAPLGMRTAVFEPDAAGMLASASFMYASARDWARFGQFLLQDGTWAGKRLLPDGWVRYMTRATPQAPRQDFGAHLWVKVPEPFNSHLSPAPALPRDAFHAAGHEGQFVSVIPSRQLVVVRLGLTRPESAWDHEAFLARVLEAFPAGSR